MAQRTDHESRDERKIVVSSAKSDTTKFLFVPGILTPFRSAVRMRQANGSIARLNKRHERGSPCLTPRITIYGSLIIPFTITTVFAFVYKFVMVLQNLGGNRICRSTRQR